MHVFFLPVSPHVVPTVAYAEDDVFLPQWAIAVIVIGLASLLFVIIFGVTVVSIRVKKFPMNVLNINAITSFLYLL